MKIIERGNLHNIQVILNWKDLNSLNQGKSIVERYDGENKILVHASHPCDLYDRDESRMQKETAIFDRLSGDISVEIPQGVLNDARYHASNFDEKLGNLKFQRGPSLENVALRIIYPESEDSYKFAA